MEVSEQSAPTARAPARIPAKEDCYFYHSMTYPDGETIAGTWDIRGRFEQYIGNYPICGKTVLDVGTASGFLAFNAEAAGATVTGLEARTTFEFKRLPVKATEYLDNRIEWQETYEKNNLTPIKNSWWYGWYKYKSNANVIYAPIEDLYDWSARFDVVFAGAVIEHISDPVTAIGALARVAREAVIIAYTDVVDTDDLLMLPMLGLDPAHDYLWWKLSRGLYVKLFANLGFDVTFPMARAVNNGPRGAVEGQRPTIVARRSRF